MNFLEDKSFITVKDFSVSGESFSLLLNEEISNFKTHPQPTLDKLVRITNLKITFRTPMENVRCLKKCIILSKEKQFGIK